MDHFIDELGYSGAYYERLDDIEYDYWVQMSERPSDFSYFIEDRSNAKQSIALVKHSFIEDCKFDGHEEL